MRHENDPGPGRWRPDSEEHVERNKRIGFTLVEMLVVISIIGLLVAISVAAFSSITKHSKVTATRGTLAACRAWVAEAAAGDPTLKSLNLANIYGGIQIAPGQYSMSTQTQDLAGAEQRTSQVIARLLTFPGNRASYDRLPAARRLATDAQGAVLNPAIVTDDFNNPILFVPGGGLWEVTKGGLKWGDPPPSPNSSTPPTNPPILSPDNLPFWVSAGPDNRFDLGDDNLYSFEN